MSQNSPRRIYEVIFEAFRFQRAPSSTTNATTFGSARSLALNAEAKNRKNNMQATLMTSTCRSESARNSWAATTRIALALIFTAPAVYAQAVTVGAIGAVPLTDTFDTGFEHFASFDPKTVRYQVGPAIDFRLPRSFRVEIDALYQPFSFNESVFTGTIPSQSHLSGNLWQFPALLKYRVPTPLVKPFVEVGPSIQIAAHLKEISTTALQPTPFVSHPDAPGAVGGIVLGGGIDLQAGRFVISPQVRYTHWISQNFNEGSPGVGSHLNQIQVLLSIRAKIR